MDWGTRRKISVIVIFLLIVFSFAGILAYRIFFKVTETCYDDLKNQNERGVDCGGICTRMCVFDVSPLIIHWQRAVKVTDGIYTAVAYVENQNRTAGIQKLQYELRMYDDKNILISEPIIGETFIGNNQKTVIVENNIPVGNKIPHTIFFKWRSQVSWDAVPKNAISRNSLIVDRENIFDIDTTPKVAIDLKNTHQTYDFKNLPLAILLYDSRGNIMAISNTIIPDLKRSSTRRVNFSWQDSFSEKPTKIEVIPQINPYNTYD